MQVGGGKKYTLQLNDVPASATALQLVVATNAAPTAAYWSGAQNGNWSFLGAANQSNWVNGPAGTDTFQTPDSTSNVFFTANTAGNFITTLGQDYTVNSLTFTGGVTAAATNSVTISAGNTLTLAALGNALTVLNGSAAHTIVANIAMGASQTWTNDGGLLTISGSSITGSDTNLTVAGSGNVALAASIQTGNGTFTKNGAGTTTLSGVNTYAGQTSINGGVVSINASNNLGNGSVTNTIAIAGGTLRNTGSLVNLGVNRSVNIGAGGATLDVTGSNSLEVSGVIGAAGSAALTKVGTGKAILSAANTYVGDTNVNEGTVLVSGSLVGETNVALGATFASGNNITSAIRGIDVAEGAILAPGDTGDTAGTTTLGRLNVGGTSQVNLGSPGTAASLRIEIGGTTGGTLYDQMELSTTSTLNLNNVNLVLSVANNYDVTSATDATFDGMTLDITTGQIFFIVYGSSSVVGGTQGYFANQGPVDSKLPGYNTFQLGGQDFAISYNANAGAGTFDGGNDVALLAIPEPNSLGMLAGSLALALGLQRFRRRRN
jgi:autotransporter-associated beta strand protein